MVIDVEKSQAYADMFPLAEIHSAKTELSDEIIGHLAYCRSEGHDTDDIVRLYVLAAKAERLERELELLTFPGGKP